MNPIRDNFPSIPPCPKCSHHGNGLQYAFPDSGAFATVQAACLSCGFHGAIRRSYSAAVQAFVAGEGEAP